MRALRLQYMQSKKFFKKSSVFALEYNEMKLTCFVASLPSLSIIKDHKKDVIHSLVMKSPVKNKHYKIQLVCGISFINITNVEEWFSLSIPILLTSNSKSKVALI